MSHAGEGRHKNRICTCNSKEERTARCELSVFRRRRGDGVRVKNIKRLITACKISQMQF